MRLLKGGMMINMKMMDYSSIPQFLFSTIRLIGFKQPLIILSLLFSFMAQAYAANNTVSCQLLCNSTGIVWKDGNRILSKSSSEPLITILYSRQSDIWKARTWVKLKPDSMKLQQANGHILIHVDSFGGQPITALLSARVLSDSSEVDWRITLWNNSSGTVVGVNGPAMRGIQNLNDASLYFPDRPGQVLADPWNKLASAPFQLAYPVPASMQYLVYAGEAGGVAFDVLDSSMSYKEFLIGGPEREFDVTQYPFIATGHKWTSPTILWQSLHGDWHAAAQRYGKWFRSWARKPQVSPEVKDFPVMGGIVVLARPVDDPNLQDVTRSMQVGTYAAALKKATELHEAGFEGVHLVGWFGKGHDSTYPDYYPAAKMGGEQQLIDMVNGMHSLHMLATFYLNARVANVTSPTYLAHPDWAVQLSNGKIIHESYGETFTVLCPGAKGFQQDLVDTVKRIAKDYHGDGVQLDQVGAASSYLCFDRLHGHTTPATAWAQGYTKMLREIRSAARKINPNFWDWIEGAWEGAGQYVDLSQGGFWPAMPGTDYFPQLYRYTLPEHPMFGDARMGGVPFWCPTDIHRAMKINLAAGSVFLHGQFMDDIGLTASPATEVHWFRGKDRAVITIINNGSIAQTYEVRLDLKQWKMRDYLKYATALASGDKLLLKNLNNTMIFSVSVPAGQVEAISIK
jgi:hypothetical protein